MSIWKQNPELMNRLIACQNSKACIHIDILTFAGMVDSIEELRKHVERYETYVSQYKPRKKRGSK